MCNSRGVMGSDAHARTPELIMFPRTRALIVQYRLVDGAQVRGTHLVDVGAAPLGVKKRGCGRMPNTPLPHRLESLACPGEGHRQGCGARHSGWRIEGGNLDASHLPGLASGQERSPLERTGPIPTWPLPYNDLHPEEGHSHAGAPFTMLRRSVSRAAGLRGCRHQMRLHRPARSPHLIRLGCPMCATRPHVRCRPHRARRALKRCSTLALQCVSMIAL